MMGSEQNLYNISFGQIQIFLTVVELSSFTNAANHLNTTQSSVSKTIAKLERELGFLLFERKYHELVLTENGNALYKSWKPSFYDMTDAYTTIHKRNEMREQFLQLGATNTTNLNKYFWDIVSSFAEKHPNIKLEYASDEMCSLVQKLSKDELDIVFVPDFMRYRIEDLGLNWEWAARDQVQVILPSNDPLANKEILGIEDIKDYEISLLSDSKYPGNKRAISEMFASAGLQSNIREKRYQTPESIIDFYEQVGGVMVTDNYFKFDETSPKVVKRALKGFQNGIICAWNNTPKSRAKDAFISHISKHNK